jgi:hypothetical protein
MKPLMASAAGMGIFLCALTYGQTLVNPLNQVRNSVTSVAGRTGAVTLTSTDVTDFAPKLSGGSLSIQPGKIRYGSSVCQTLATAMAVTPTGGSGGPGTGKLYIDDTCTMVLAYPSSLSLTATASGVTLIPAAAPTVSADGYPVANVVIQNGTFIALTDTRAPQGSMGYIPENAANKDQNGGYVGRGADGSAAVPGGLSTGTGPLRISSHAGACPATAVAGYDYTLCIESGVLYSVSASGTKTSAGGGSVVASGSTDLGTTAINAEACATAITVTANGALSTDTVVFSPNASIKAVTGYTPGVAGGLTVAGYPGANAVTFDVCNWSSGQITPGAVRLNWRVIR